MSRKNSSLVADLAGAIDAPADASKSRGMGIGVLAGRGNRLAELASGNLVSSVQELVDPARCRMWAGHNRDYAALSEARCHDLIESLKAQGKQEVPAIVRRVTGDPDCEFEVVCGARRHWSVSWLRSHNYPAFKFLVDVRTLTDEEAFRLGDLENRARDDISDLERARDYLRALGTYYGGRQIDMAQRMNTSESWLSRYLDLARLPATILGAFADPHALGIKHVATLKPLLKPEDRRKRVLAAAERIAGERAAGQGVPATVPDTIRVLAAAADSPRKSGPPKRSGSAPETVAAPSGMPVLRVDKRSARALTLTLLPASGATRQEAEAAIGALLDAHWPKPK